jgi:hypothetical protein
MSRQSADEYQDGHPSAIVYNLQVWVEESYIVRCGTLVNGFDCDCNGRKYAGMRIDDALAIEAIGRQSN